MTEPDPTEPTNAVSRGDVGDALHLRCADAVEIVTDYLDGALSAHDLSVFEAHVADCDGCTVFVDQLRMTIALTGASGQGHLEFMPANFDALLAELQARANPPA